MIHPSVRLRRAIHLNDPTLVRRIIRANPKLSENPDFEDKSNTSLHLATQKGHLEIVESLLDAGHDEEEISRNTDGDTPLLSAAKEGCVDVGKLLIERFPSCISLGNREGLDALALSSQQPLSTGLIPPSLSHHTNPASPHNRDHNGNTPSHHASASGSSKALRILLSAGADPSAKNAYDWTPLAYSQTVAAEVYFKNSVAEFERRRVENINGERERERRKGAGVRLITDDQQGSFRPGEAGDTAGWSPVDVRGPMTPNYERRMHFGPMDDLRRVTSGD